VTDERLTHLLHDRISQERVGQPPLHAMHRDAARRRRGRSAVVVAAVGVAMVGGLFAATGDDASPQPRPAEVATASDTPPAGFRWVGIGAAVVAVPHEWGTNAVRCGTPERDTVIVDQGAVCAALFPFPADTSAVEVRPRYSVDDRDGYTETRVEGEQALLSPVECPRGRTAGAHTCRRTLVLPARDIVFAAETSRGRAALDDILARVAILDQDVAVPGYSLLALDHQGRAGAAYSEALRDAGLQVKIVTQTRRGIEPGYVLGAVPSPGAVVEAGSRVTVTVVAAPSGPGDEIVMGMAGNRGGQDIDVSDDRLRRNPTVRLAVGDRLWTYAHGERQRTYGAQVSGHAIQEDGWKDGPNYPNSWIADRPGRSKIELSIEVDGERLVLGTVTVVVR